LYSIIVLAIVAVVIVLAIGLGGFVAGGEFNRKYGNKMMRLRILFQAIAVARSLLYGWRRSQGGQ